jgi:hypothetical protein
METRVLNRINFFLWVLLFFPIVSEAGRINNIFFDNATIIIRHSGCELKPPIKGKRKLILPINSCASDAGKINIVHPNLEKIHWAQHDPKTVWIVATFSTEYEFEIVSSPYQYQVCLPSCSKKKQKNQKDWFSERRDSKKMMFLLHDILFQIPLEGMLIDDFLARSIGYFPQKDVVRDGLPHFGSKRDDWKGKTRKHQGYDIYADKINVVAVADGSVTRVKRTPRAGLYVKLHHGNKLYTVYVHLKRALVKRGQKVKQGDIIGRIDGPSGNAVEAQLHFAVKPNNKAIDPLPLVKEFYRDDSQVIDKIKGYERTLKKSIPLRNRAVKNFLSSQ